MILGKGDRKAKWNKSDKNKNKWLTWIETGDITLNMETKWKGEENEMLFEIGYYLIPLFMFVSIVVIDIKK